MKLRRHFNTPLQFTHNGFQDLAYPVWNSFQSGILATPTFVSAGRVYVSDVFCKPSVAKKSLALEVTVANPSGGAASGDIVCEAVNAKSGAVEKKFAAVPFPFQLGGMTTAALHIAEPWENPKLWWPDDPNMYRLRATVRFGKASEDVCRNAVRISRMGHRRKELHFERLRLAWLEHRHPRQHQGKVAGELP